MGDLVYRNTYIKVLSTNSVDGATDDYHIAEIFRQKFTFSGTQPLDSHDAYNVTNLVEMKAGVFSVEEVDTAVRCLPVGNAAGIGRLIAEHVLFSHPSLVQVIIIPTCR